MDIFIRRKDIMYILEEYDVDHYINDDFSGDPNGFVKYNHTALNFKAPSDTRGVIVHFNGRSTCVKNKDGDVMFHVHTIGENIASGYLSKKNAPTYYFFDEDKRVDEIQSAKTSYCIIAVNEEGYVKVQFMDQLSFAAFGASMFVRNYDPANEPVPPLPAWYLRYGKMLDQQMEYAKLRKKHGPMFSLKDKIDK